MDKLTSRSNKGSARHEHCIQRTWLQLVVKVPDCLNMRAVVPAEIRQMRKRIAKADGGVKAAALGSLPDCGDFIDCEAEVPNPSAGP